jgi:oxygen-independent coproporphyrinogen III oxidase
MCDFAVDYGALARAHGLAPEAFDDASAELEALAEQGLVAFEDRRVEMTRAGRPFVRLAATAFDAYLKHGAGRHSAAV